MENFYCKYLLNIPASIPSNDGAKLVNDTLMADSVLSNLSLLGYVVPVEAIMLGIFFYILLSHTIGYNSQLLFRERFKLVIHMLHYTHTPLVLLRDQLEEIVVKNLPEPTTWKLKQALENAERIIGYNQNAMSLDKASWKNMPAASVVEFELYTYIISIVDLCRVHANSRRVRLEVCECPDYISCRINEAVMTVALQHLLNKMIDITPSEGCVSITISHSKKLWKLLISNCGRTGNGASRIFSVMSAISSVYCFNDLWTVRKIIRLHGGKIVGRGYGKVITYQVIIPKECNIVQCKTGPDMGLAMERQKVRWGQYPSMGKDKLRIGKKEADPSVLLAMTDRKYSDYLRVAFSVYFKCVVLENPDMIVSVVMQSNPDAIIIDETVNGVDGEEICSRIKSNNLIASIPVVLLVKASDNESYLSHAGSGADRLELRTVNICRLRTDISMLIGSHIVMLERMKRFVADAVAPTLTAGAKKEDVDMQFMDKVHELLEKNLATEAYTIDMLSADMGMSRSSFYAKIKKITGQPPAEYMFLFKMDKAKILLASQQYTIGEIATMLGFCDSKYFAKRFKEVCNICPSKYIETVIG